ncbi:MAG: NERD domain-containing protein [Desulfurivibrio sp.]|nr:MAG: NERD domain-containing protein [Desulfurivibrio sp.]
MTGFIPPSSGKRKAAQQVAYFQQKFLGFVKQMNSILILFLPASISLLSFLLLIPMVIWIRYQRRHRRNPLTYQMLRAPGEAISLRIEQLDDDIDAYLMAASILPLLCYSSFITARYIAQQQPSLPLFITIGLIGSGFIGFRLYMLIRQRHNESLGLDCERAVGQELNQLMLNGCRVYHDFSGDGFNIDHIVIGANGVFAIETKGRSKTDMAKGQDAVKVVYDGHMLRFPTWSEQEPIVQAKRQAAWLSNWLSMAVGEKVSVTPALALAGWFVDRKKNDLTQV